MSRPTAFAQPMQLVEPSETVQLEHQDRKNRLVRLAKLQGIPPPDFFEYSIDPSQHGLKSYPVPIPVLRVVFPANVFFDFDQDIVRPEAVPILETIAGSLRLEPPDVTMFVAGHTDAIGSENYNLDLGLRRARAVAADLVKRGVNQAQMFDISFGKAVPLESNDTEAGRARNRRVEFLFSARPEPIAAWLVEQPVPPCTDSASSSEHKCPVRETFKAESVNLSMPKVGLNLQESRTAIPLRQDPKSIHFGAQVVDIDLHQKVFRFEAPE